ncbi:MAG: nitrogen regulation protein NR(I) [Advenella sp.]|uniref:DNA-binding transcriptional regulator NtrC n=1 Tax=Advenella kashmirensis TaxID=310575 RepID=A0A356LIK3_9BURK|nr:nitrogen regulation protein NR(I) [Advenella kashmirensis]
MKTIWVVDDDQAIRWVLDKALQRAGMAPTCFERARDVLDALQTERPDVLVTDIRMPDMSGIDLLKAIKQRAADLPVIVMTAYTDLDSTVTAFHEGAFDYLVKPFDVNEAVALIERAYEHGRENAEHVVEQSVLAPALAADYDKMMTQSASRQMQEIFRAIGRLAPSKVTVLITGESGTGKELIARAVHKHGTRAGKPFIALNAAAIPRDLLEAELFGHERGSFTGASAQRRGRFEEANGGTLFLDEIGDMPLELQTRLLRVLAEGNFYRIGGSQPVSVDVRIIAATHQPLEVRVEQGTFREDLFHRLNVIRLRVPPLRERREDIGQLAAHFLKVAASSLGVAPKQLSPEALDILQQFDFPGNVRQLENFCHWLTVMSPAQRIDRNDLPPELMASLSFSPRTERASDGVAPSAGIVGGASDTTTHWSSAPTAAAASPLSHAPLPGSDNSQPNWLDKLEFEVQQRLQSNEKDIMAHLTQEFERIVLTTTLENCRGRRIDAAARLGIGRNTVTRKLKELGIENL